MTWSVSERAGATLFVGMSDIIAQFTTVAGNMLLKARLDRIS